MCNFCTVVPQSCQHWSQAESREILGVCHASGRTKSELIPHFGHGCGEVAAGEEGVSRELSHYRFVQTSSPSRGTYKSSQHVQFIYLVCLIWVSTLVLRACKLLHVRFSISACVHSGHSVHLEKLIYEHQNGSTLFSFIAIGNECSDPCFYLPRVALK